MKKCIKVVISVIGIIFVICAYKAYMFVDYAFFNCINHDITIKIYPDDTKDSLIVKFGSAIDSGEFAKYYDLFFDGQIKSGNYQIKSGISQRKLLRMLSHRYQTPINVVFNNVSTLEDLSGKVSRCLMVDSITMLDYLQSERCYKQYVNSRDLLPIIFIPNTYQMYWTSTPEEFVDRMYKEYCKFWNEERRKKASNLGLTIEQVSILASIVDKETICSDDKTPIAGVYINRLKRGMPLQACPTVKYAVGDMTLRRVLNKHLEIDSPYNTYKNLGLPPGPISMPDSRTIDSVLEYTGHSYLYFCASADLSGRSVFAKTLSEHNRNADAYRNQLNRLKIYK